MNVIKSGERNSFFFVSLSLSLSLFFAWFFYSSVLNYLEVNWEGYWTQQTIPLPLPIRWYLIHLLPNGFLCCCCLRFYRWFSCASLIWLYVDLAMPLLIIMFEVFDITTASFLPFNSESNVRSTSTMSSSIPTQKLSWEIRKNREDNFYVFLSISIPLFLVHNSTQVWQWVVYFGVLSLIHSVPIQFTLVKWMFPSNHSYIFRLLYPIFNQFT